MIVTNKPTPSQLAFELVEIVAEVCNVHAMWSEHQQAITINEMAKISAKIEKHLEQRCHDVSVAAEAES